jgi:ketosteroid isomerase-like protein
MRTVTFVMALVVAGTAWAKPGKGGGHDATAAATAALDKFEAAWNAHDAKAACAFLDKGFFGAGSTVSSKQPDVEAGRAQLEKDAAAGGRITRDALTIKGDESGDTAWWIGDYTFVPKVPPGALPVRRKMRASGVLVRHAGNWTIAMMHISAVQPDVPATSGAGTTGPSTSPAPPPVPPAAPPKK